jgi:hypothetical protein
MMPPPRYINVQVHTETGDGSWFSDALLVQWNAKHLALELAATQDRQFRYRAGKPSSIKFPTERMPFVETHMTSVKDVCAGLFRRRKSP